MLRLQQSNRSKDKSIPLPKYVGEEHKGQLFELSEDRLKEQSQRLQLQSGRVCSWSICQQLDLKRLYKVLVSRFGSEGVSLVCDEVLRNRVMDEVGDSCGSVFYFAFGVVVCWSLTSAQQFESVIVLTENCQSDSISQSEIEVDELGYYFTQFESPYVQNDTLVLSTEYAGDESMMISVSYALAQSTKLSIDEEHITKLAQRCGYAKRKPISRLCVGRPKEVSKLMGRIFILKSRINLSSHILDTPEFLWSKPDRYLNMYTGVCNYMEIDERIQAVNRKLEVITSMLNALRSSRYQQNTILQAKIVLWLLVVSIAITGWQIIQFLLGFKIHRLKYF
eukprot:TRINITY_DN2906_c0_g1_i6.p1 TRINITY_DN2906_c0_g1~~TRINITY_DN2906_c0_g1_i6.p1  ORF type:complete len:336 (-),score=9.67 TRINITY_DN2906_c0_g1_i6:291-1298(-)